MATRCFEDFQPGQVYELGTAVLTADEIVRFARQFDPQPFHLDAEAAKDSAFGGLIASGWHTAGVFMRLYVDAVLANSSSMGSPGIEQLRWLVPVRPGDVLTGRFTVVSTAPSSRRADRGTVHFRGELSNQQGQTVVSLQGRGFFGRRSPV